jgi:sulfur-carrier protein adenylyltransferase/sulfurtransferase
MPIPDLARYSRQLILPGFGVEGQERLAAARVLVVGAGGLGSTVIPALAAAGVGTVGIIDSDTVEISNLARQTMHGQADVGRLKVESGAESVARLNPSTVIRSLPMRIVAANALEILADYDLVVDGSDNFPTRYLVDDAAAITGIPSVWGAISQYGGQAGVSFAFEGTTYRDLFPVPPAPGTVPSCEEAGVLPTVCAIIGGIMASEVIKLITGVGRPLFGRVTSYDARTGSFRELSYESDPETAPITELIDYDLFCNSTAEEQTAPSAPEMGSAETSGSVESGNNANDANNANDNSGEPARTGANGPVNMNAADTNPADNTLSGDISAEELSRALEAGEPIQLIDVREEWEASIARIEGSSLIPLGDLAYRWGELDPDATTVVYCHAGIRSEKGRDILRSVDFANVRSLTGGIDAWSRNIDPNIARY